MVHYIGLDVGTTNIKAALFSQKGELVEYHSEPTSITHPREGWSEFDPVGIWNSVCSCIKQITAKVSPEDICSVGISSLGEAGLITDEDGVPLSNIIAWYDPRARQQIAFLKEQLGVSKIYSVTGQTPSDKYGICKLMWIKDNKPEAYRTAKHWLSVEDWILFCLTGKYATDYSVASRTMAFDIINKCWSEEILRAAGLRTELFPEAYPGGTLIGRVTEKASLHTGLNTATCVSAGGHDHACASIAVNIFEDGVVLDSMGTAEVAMVAISKPVLNEETLNRYYSVYPHCGDKLYRVLTSNQSCGASIDWYLKTFGSDLIRKAGRLGISEYEYLLGKIDTDSSEVGKLYFAPFLRGSVEDPNLRGVFFGVDDSHRCGNFIAGIVDGICYELKKQIDGYGQTFKQSFDKLRVVGGLSKSERIMQRKSTIQQSMVEVPVCTEAACLGAALLGAIGAGKLTFDRLDTMYRCGRRYQAQTDGREQQEYETYLKIRDRVKETYAVL